MKNNFEEEIESNEVVNEEEKESLPKWMRYLPNPPWDSNKIHLKLHLKEENKIKNENNEIIQKKRNYNENNESNENIIILKEQEENLNNKNNFNQLNNNKRRRKEVNVSMDEMSLLVSYCKVNKEIS